MKDTKTANIRAHWWSMSTTCFSFVPMERGFQQSKERGALLWSCFLISPATSLLMDDIIFILHCWVGGEQRTKKTDQKQKKVGFWSDQLLKKHGKHSPEFFTHVVAQVHLQAEVEASLSELSADSAKNRWNDFHILNDFRSLKDPRCKAIQKQLFTSKTKNATQQVVVPRNWKSWWWFQRGVK